MGSFVVGGAFSDDSRTAPRLQVVPVLFRRTLHAGAGDGLGRVGDRVGIAKTGGRPGLRLRA